MRYLTLSEGRLFLHEPGRPPTEIESPFAQEVAAREETRQERHGWKGREREGAGPYSGRVVWGRQADGAASRQKPSIKHVTRGSQPDEIFYVVAMAHSCGLFRRNLATGEEWRLFHKQDFSSCGLSCDARTGRVVIASRGADQVSKLQLVDEDDRRRDAITGGDGHDILPAFDRGAPEWILYQTAGVARDEDGHIVAFGPAEIHRVDAAQGRHEVVLADERWDFLCPQRSPDGRLHYIRRPFRSRHSVSWVEHARAFVLFPVRLGVAVFGFLEVFTRYFGKESLRPTGGPGVPDVPVRAHFATFLDEPVRLDRVNRRLARGDSNVRVVPVSWELVRRDAAGLEETIDRHVVTYDCGPNGELVYSDGVRVWVGGKPDRVTSGLVQQVICL